jgi:hypothetical protein
MKIDFSQAMTELNGTVVKKADGKTDLLLNDVCTTALVANDTTLPAEERFRRGVLAQEIYNGLNDISPEDVVTIRACIGKVYGPLIVSKAYKMLGE